MPIIKGQQDTCPIILTKPGIFELEEKRSKFIGYCTSVKNEAEARVVISEIRAAHSKANHNVFAYATVEDNIIRMSDDGEPSGTAGMPVLNVFQKSGIIDYVCVVTRYFGGTLLGAGGLVRAYSKAAKGAMEAAEPQELIIKTLYRVTCEYNRFDQVKYNLDKWDIPILNAEFTTHCTLTVEVTEAQKPQFLADINYTVVQIND